LTPSFLAVRPVTTEAILGTLNCQVLTVIFPRGISVVTELVNGRDNALAIAPVTRDATDTACAVVVNELVALIRVTVPLVKIDRRECAEIVKGALALARWAYDKFGHENLQLVDTRLSENTRAVKRSS
jgi:hypothetical protein